MSSPEIERILDSVQETESERAVEQWPSGAGFWHAGKYQGPVHRCVKSKLTTFGSFHAIRYCPICFDSEDIYI